MESELWAEVFLYNIIDPSICYDRELDNYKELSLEAIDYLFKNKSKTEYKSYYIRNTVYDRCNDISDEFQITISNNSINGKANDGTYEINMILEKTLNSVNNNFISSNINSSNIYSCNDESISIDTIYFQPKELKLNKEHEIVNILRPNSIYTNIRIKYRLVYDHVLDLIALLE